MSPFRRVFPKTQVFVANVGASDAKAASLIGALGANDPITCLYDLAPKGSFRFRVAGGAAAAFCVGVGLFGRDPGGRLNLAIYKGAGFGWLPDPL